MMEWEDAVLASVRHYCALHGTPDFELRLFWAAEGGSITSAREGDVGKTPKQTLNRVLHQLGKEKSGPRKTRKRFLEINPENREGWYRLLDYPIDVLPQDSPDEGLELGPARPTNEVSSALAQHDDASENSSQARNGRALIVTWNPDKGKWDQRPQGYNYAVDQTAQGETVIEDWSTGVRNRGVYWGDRAFLLRQGNKGRGLIATGTVRGEIREIPHWNLDNSPEETANTVDIEWECVLPVDEILPKEELEQKLPEIYWSPAGSGVLIEGESADRLVDLWSNHLLRIGRGGPLPVENPVVNSVESAINPRRKFGRDLTAAENAAIEKRAVIVTREHFEKKGYETTDVGATFSYDVHATKGREIVKIEVKGTTTDGGAVVLTRNEVNLHREAHPDNALAVVRNITLGRSGDQPVASGGELKLIMPWKINEDRLSAVAYDYRTGI